MKEYQPADTKTNQFTSQIVCTSLLRPFLLLMALESIKPCKLETVSKMSYHPSGTPTSEHEVILSPLGPRSFPLTSINQHQNFFSFFLSLSKISSHLMRYEFLSQTFPQEEAISNIDLPSASVLDTACFNFARTQPIPGLTVRYTQLFPLSDRSHFHLSRPGQSFQVLTSPTIRLK